MQEIKDLSTFWIYRRVIVPAVNGKQQHFHACILSGLFYDGLDVTDYLLYYDTVSFFKDQFSKAGEYDVPVFEFTTDDSDIWLCAAHLQQSYQQNVVYHVSTD